MNLAIADAAQAVARAHEERAPYDETTARLAIASLDEAYDIQHGYVARLTERFGEPAGYKIGLTSPAMQEMCRIDSPMAGVILSKRVWPSGSLVSVSRHVHVGIEFEIAVRLGKALPPDGAPYGREAVAAAVDGVAPAFEIVDDRGADYSRLDARALVADNGWNVGAVLGEFSTQWPDLASVRGVIECNGEVIAEGTGRDALGHPLNSVAWLVNELAPRGTGLRPGEIVLTGSIARTRFAEPGERYRLTVSDLGAVEVAFGD